MRSLFVVLIILLSSSVAHARWEPTGSKNDSDYNYAKTKKRGLIIFTIVDADSQPLSTNYGFALYTENHKKLIKSGSGQDSYELTLPSGTYVAEVYQKNEGEASQLLTVYRKVQVLPDTIVHKKLFINHVNELESFSAN